MDNYRELDEYIMKELREKLKRAEDRAAGLESKIKELEYRPDRLQK